MKRRYLVCTLALITPLLVAGCGSDVPTEVEDLGITPVANADARSSYVNAKTDIHISYWDLPRPEGSGNLSDAIAYLDADGDGDTDVFLATGEFLSQGEVNSILALNDGSGQFVSSTAEFSGSMPPATHARKSIVSDFDNNNLLDIFVFDHGFDSNPYPGSQPKLIMQDSRGSFSWSKVTATGFHHGGAAADIDNDGDIDVFVGGFDPFFLINDGSANFSVVGDRFDHSMAKVFSAELIDVDRDGYVDLLIGAHERDGDQTAVYWGNSTGAYTQSQRTILPTVASFGAVLDFDAEDFDGDGDRDLVVNRTRDGDDGPGLGFYQGRTVQLLLNDGSRGFTDATSANVDSPGGDTDGWFPWVRAWDIDNDGDLDICPDNAVWGFAYLNDGSGRFTRADL